MSISPSSRLDFFDRLANGPLLCAEGYVFELERRGYVKAGPYVPEVVLDNPEALRQLHREFLAAGSDVMVALTYYAHREKLAVVGRDGELEAMNRAALTIAKEVAAEGNALVAGNICNTWAYDVNDIAGSSRVVRAMYEEQVGWAVDEGVDFILSETNDFVGEALIALDVIKDFGLPAVVNFATVQATATVDGVPYAEACQQLADAGADIVGLNCSRGPATLLPVLREVRQALPHANLAAVPVPYRTTDEHFAFQSLESPEGEHGYLIALETNGCNRFDMAQFAKDALDLDIAFIGICCGAGPHHVRAMAEAMGRTVPGSRYSPAFELHPVLGNERDNHAEFTPSWKA